ncbi:hypothetical protein NC969_26740 [Leptolyngbya subtilissima ST-M1]|uniref:hypothetical protein n=1 Tax=Cyanophyceae TaxID=3028117 RepID=UPI0018EFF7C9|nr:hypothetical protein [Nodosilinea sp. FACHB-131]
MSDALDRLKQRQRPKVAPRDASLISKPQDVQTPKSQDIQISRHIEDEGMAVDAGVPGLLEPVKSRHTDIQMSEALNTGIAVGASRHTDIQASRHIEIESEPPTKRSTFRLEADLIERLHTFCRHQGLSREVLIEAMYEYMEANPEALAQVVENASQKHDNRQQLANRKRAEAMMSKFGRDA